MSAEFTLADNLLIDRCNVWKLRFPMHRRKMVTGRMASPMIIPVLRDAKNMVQVLLTDDAESIQHFVLERLNYPLDKCLEIR